MSKQVSFSEVIRQSILKGISIVAQAVTLTLGPRGRNVIIEQRQGPPVVTKDGVTVAKAIDLEDPYENLGARMLIEAAAKTNDVSGDGTTTTVLLSEAIYREGIKHIVAGANPMELKAGIELAVQEVVKELKRFAKPVSDKTEIAQVATVAANGDAAIGAYISDAVEKVGKDGIVTIEESKNMETTIDLVDGMRFDNGYLSAHFSTDVAKQAVVFNDPYILIHEKKISDIQSLVPILEKVATTGKPLLIISEDLDTLVLTTLVINKLKGIIQSCAVKAPSFGVFRKSILEDIAVLTGGQAITDDIGVKLSTVTLDKLGRAKKVIVTKDTTTIIEGAGKRAEIDARIALIRNQQSSEASDFNKEKFQQRLAHLAGGVAVINVGATTESELVEKKFRIEDALQATQAAVHEGIVPGGGTALVKCIAVLGKVLLEDHPKDVALGIKIVQSAISEPVKKIAANAGKTGIAVFEKVAEYHRLNNDSSYGYNARQDTYEDLLVAGVLDPVKVTRAALENAASIAGLLLTTDCAIVEIRKKDVQQGPGQFLG